MAVTFSSRQVSRVRDVLARLYGLRKAARFYPPGHPAVAEGIDQLFKLVKQYHDEGVDVPLTFFEDELLLGEQLLTEESVLFDQLIREMSSIGAGSLTFKKGLTEEELTRAVPVLAADQTAVDKAGGMQALSEAANTPHLVVSGVVVVEKATMVEKGHERDAAKQVYGSAIELLRELETVLRTSRAPSANHVKGVVRSLIDSVINNRYAMLELSGLKNYDEYTFYHSVNVSILSLALGSALSTDRRFLSSLGVGALMHDIGKMGIDVDVLNKPGALSSDEWESVREHPVWGAEMAAKMPGLDKSAVVIILEHHMRYDMQGYPRVPDVERAQRLPSRIVAIADAYDAMTSRRSYSAARLRDEAVSILAQNMGKAFDPVLVRVFINVMGVYPPRSVVRLESGETAIVVAANENKILSPKLRVFADAAGNVISPFDIDLSRPEEAAGRRIESSLDGAKMNIDVEDYL